MDVADWLRKLGLEQYEPAFRANEIDDGVLPSLTAEDLKDLGVTLVGHRRRLLDAIVALGSPLPNLPPPAGEGRVGAEAERRQLSVMFCDLIGSTALSARLDPEDLREVIGAYHRTVAGVVAEFDGFVSRYMGDGVLVYFGYPQAHEDDTERAVRAGLGAIDAVSRLDVKSVKLQTRVGIATGLVVVGDLIGEGSAQEQSVVGETPDLAARLQALAEPDTVVIAAGTRRLVGDLFEYRDLGTVEVKGIVGPVSAWQALRGSVVASRFEALRGLALTRLVGRDEEIELLLRRWGRAKAGNGQVVLISGEPGIGKSRLTAELAERFHAEPHVSLRYFCSPYHQDSALYPFVDQLGRASGFARDDPPAAKLEKLETLLARARPRDEDVAFLADLMSLPASERHPLPDLSPQRKKERILEALLRHLEGLARQQPVVMVFEDTHWVDPTSRELLDLIIERIGSYPMLLIVTFRPEFHPPWTGQPQVSMLALNRLDRRDRTVLVEQIAGGKVLPDDVVAQIVDRTDGVPLFVEELTKSVLESGLLREEADRYVLDRALPPFAIPTSLHDSLMARLDRLASVRLVAQTGAAIGREFSYALLRAVSRLSEDDLQASLARLVASELVFQRGTPPDATYSFKHALVQDAAHGSLLRSSRQQLHAQIAEALETHSPELMDSQPELFAQHYAEAGLVEKSVTCWGRAGRRSAARSAMAEAAAQFQKGLDQLALLPDTPERQRQELEFLNSLGWAWRFAKGLAAPETGSVFARAQDIWEQLGSPSELFEIPWRLSLHHQNRGELDLAMRLDENLLRLSLERKNSAALAIAHRSAGRTFWLAGKFVPSRSHLEAWLAADQIGSLSDRSSIQGCLGIVVFCLGFVDQALAHSNAVITAARRLTDPISFASTLSIGIKLLLFLGDDAAVDEWAGQLVAVATEQGFPPLVGEGRAFLGCVEVKKGNVAEGMSLLRSGAAAYHATGAEIMMPFYAAFLAEAFEIAGQVEEGLTLLDDALQIVERTGERWFAAELNRHKGQLLLRQGHSEAAEKLYHKALSIAQEQEAKLWELRAAASLARLRRDQGRRAEARDLLAPVYRWFTEGFDTPDLKEAKALLDELEARLAPRATAWT
jgi:class 3 adenylate cyclase/tetratricopeptide (TPR) repeat protein